jgi:hypothetical protein
MTTMVRPSRPALTVDWSFGKDADILARAYARGIFFDLPLQPYLGPTLSAAL